MVFQNNIPQFDPTQLPPYPIPPFVNIGIPPIMMQGLPNQQRSTCFPNQTQGYMQGHFGQHFSSPPPICYSFFPAPLPPVFTPSQMQQMHQQINQYQQLPKQLDNHTSVPQKPMLIKIAGESFSTSASARSYTRTKLKEKLGLTEDKMEEAFDLFLDIKKDIKELKTSVTAMEEIVNKTDSSVDVAGTTLFSAWWTYKEISSYLMKMEREDRESDSGNVDRCNPQLNTTLEMPPAPPGFSQIGGIRGVEVLEPVRVLSAPPDLPPLGVSCVGQTVQSVGASQTEPVDQLVQSTPAVITGCSVVPSASKVPIVRDLLPKATAEPAVVAPPVTSTAPVVQAVDNKGESTEDTPTTVPTKTKPEAAKPALKIVQTASQNSKTSPEVMSDMKRLTKIDFERKKQAPPTADKIVSEDQRAPAKRLSFAEAAAAAIAPGAVAVAEAAANAAPAQTPAGQKIRQLTPGRRGGYQPVPAVCGRHPPASAAKSHNVTSSGLQQHRNATPATQKNPTQTRESPEAKVTNKVPPAPALMVPPVQKVVQTAPISSTAAQKSAIARAIQKMVSARTRCVAPGDPAGSVTPALNTEPAPSAVIVPSTESVPHGSAKSTPTDSAVVDFESMDEIPEPCQPSTSGVEPIAANLYVLKVPELEPSQPSNSGLKPIAVNLPVSKKQKKTKKKKSAKVKALSPELENIVVVRTDFEKELAQERALMAALLTFYCKDDGYVRLVDAKRNSYDAHKLYNHEWRRPPFKMACKSRIRKFLETESKNTNWISCGDDIDKTSKTNHKIIFYQALFNLYNTYPKLIGEDVTRILTTTYMTADLYCRRALAYLDITRWTFIDQYLDRVCKPQMSQPDDPKPSKIELELKNARAEDATEYDNYANLGFFQQRMKMHQANAESSPRSAFLAVCYILLYNKGSKQNPSRELGEIGRRVLSFDFNWLFQLSRSSPELLDEKESEYFDMFYFDAKLKAKKNKPGQGDTKNTK